MTGGALLGPVAGGATYPSQAFSPLLTTLSVYCPRISGAEADEESVLLGVIGSCGLIGEFVWCGVGAEVDWGFAVRCDERALL